MGDLQILGSALAWNVSRVDTVQTELAREQARVGHEKDVLYRRWNTTRSGVSPSVAQKLMRHSDIRLTMNTYTHLDLADTASAVAALPAMAS